MASLMGIVKIIGKRSEVQNINEPQLGDAHEEARKF